MNVILKYQTYNNAETSSPINVPLTKTVASKQNRPLRAYGVIHQKEKAE